MRPITFTRDEDGMVELGGDLAEDETFVLPEGFRPARIERRWKTSSTGAECLVEIHPDGRILVRRRSSS